MENQSGLYLHTYQNGCIRNGDTIGAGEGSGLRDQSSITGECANGIITVDTDWQVPQWQPSSDQEIVLLDISLKETKQNLGMTL